MPFSPENNERAKKLLLVGAALAAGSYALKHDKDLGRKIRSVRILGSDSVVMEHIPRKVKESIRLTGTAIFDPENKVIDVKFDDENEDLSMSSLLRLERTFTDSRMKRAQLFLAEILSRTRLYK